MTEAGTVRQESHKPPQRRTFLAILGRSLMLYGRHWQRFTSVLLWPVAQILLGIYASQVLPLLFLNIAIPYASGFPWFLIGGVLILALLSMLLMLRGTWQYLIYWASLCENAWEAEEERFIDFRMAYEGLLLQKRTAYTVLLCAYFGLPFIALLPLLVLAPLGGLLGQSMLELLLVLGVLQSMILTVVWFFSLILFSFVFQIAAFENGLPVNPGHVFMLSAKLVLKRFWSTLFLQITVFLTTNLLIPHPLIWLARMTHLSAPLDWLHGWLLRETLRGDESVLQSLPFIGGLMTDEQLSGVLIHSLTDMTLVSTVTLLLLPFGTFVFTLLYKDILRCDRSKKTFLGG